MDEKLATERKLEKATFAGGCFWCMQPPFRMVEGVVDVVSGYAGGTKENPTYEEVSSGTTGHLEAVQVTYDPAKVSYEALLDTFWRQIDPTDPSGQFADQGSQYRTAIFYHDEEQRRLAEESKKRLDASGKFRRPVATEIRPFTNFYPAEEYHQDYDRKNPVRYHQYKVLSGREGFIGKTWGIGGGGGHGWEGPEGGRLRDTRVHRLQGGEGVPDIKERGVHRGRHGRRRGGEELRPRKDRPPEFSHRAGRRRVHHRVRPEEARKGPGLGRGRGRIGTSPPCEHFHPLPSTP